MGSLFDFEIDGGSIPAYRADPEGAPRGAVIVIHEVWGLVGHIRDVADRFAAAGYLAIAPDILTNAGVPPEVGDELQRLMFSGTDEERAGAQPLMREKLSVANAPEYAEWATRVLAQVVDFLAAQSEVQGRIFVVGFCFGGSYAYALAADDLRVRGAVPFYGTAPEHASVADIRCPVLAFYGEQDGRVTSGIPELTEAFKASGTDYTPVVYPGVGHAFFNDTNPVTYSPEVAEDAWRRTLDFLAR